MISPLYYKGVRTSAFTKYTYHSTVIVRMFKNDRTYVEIHFAEGSIKIEDDKYSIMAVSYTHLDVYKRQGLLSSI